MQRTLLCFAEGRPGCWEAICLDLDIAVQGASQEEVVELLRAAIETYFQDAMQERPEVRDRLLSRSVPLHVRARHVLGFLWHALRGRRADRLHAGFQVSCRV